MKFKENKLIGGGGNSLKSSHNQDFRLLEAFNNLAPWGEKKFVSELKRTYKFQRGVNNRLDCHTNQTRILSKEYSFVAGDYVRSTAHHSLKSAAFTLAEVLVTLGIIGVVSAMTVPTLMQNYQRQSYVTQLHKTYNEFTQAFLQYKNDRNALWLTEAGHTRHQDMMPFMKQYFKVVQECGTTSTPCFASSYKNQNGGTYVVDTLNRGATYYGVLASGVSFGIMYDALDTGTIYTDDFSYRIVVDINGKKGPNIYGRDLFVMYVFPDGVIDVYYANPACRENNSCLYGKANVTDWRESVAANCASANGEVWHDGCFARILNDNWQMNY